MPSRAAASHADAAAATASTERLLLVVVVASAAAGRLSETRGVCGLVTSCAGAPAWGLEAVSTAVAGLLLLDLQTKEGERGRRCV